MNKYEYRVLLSNGDTLLVNGIQEGLFMLDKVERNGLQGEIQHRTVEIVFSDWYESIVEGEIVAYDRPM